MYSTEIFQEGVRLPPTQVVRGGQPMEDIWTIIEANVRFPRSAIGDMKAQFTVAAIGEHRLGALFDRYGRDTVEAAAEEIFRQSEQLDREAIRAIPDGVPTGEGFLDSDGVGDGPVNIRVKITVDGERLVFDLTDTDAPGQNSINCGAVQTLSGCRLAFKYLFNSHQPVNGGTLRPLEVRTGPGSILAARPHAACQFYFTPLGLMIHLICSALPPTLITDYGYRQDSVGPSRWRGGNGIIREYQMTTDTEMSLWFGRSGNPAWGLLGGKDGAPPEVISSPQIPEEVRRLKTNRMPLRKGDIVRCYTGGGGGYGNPLQRDPQALLTDLADGHISPDYARRHHRLNSQDITED